MKKLVVCLDAIGNIVRRRPSNVLKVAHSTRSLDDHGAQQVVSYDSGVGLMNRAPDWGAKLLRLLDKVLGGAWGAGFENSVERAYNFLSANYRAGDEIFIFGYSRGAGQARSLCQLIDWAGGFPPRHEAFFLPTLVARYLQGLEPDRSLIDVINDRRRQRGREDPVEMCPTRIRFLGLWDTLLPLRPRIWARRHARRGRPEHLTSTVPANVDIVRHALAIDERRHDFRARPLAFGTVDACDLQQRWFAGGHADVGGGRHDDGLANAALRWMCDEAALAGLSFETDFATIYPEAPLGRSQSKQFNYKIMDTLLWPLRGYNGVREVGGADSTIDPSVVIRLNADAAEHQALDGPYRPANLIRFLAENSQYNSELCPEVLQEVERCRARCRN